MYLFFFLQFLVIMDASTKSSFSYWSKRRRVHNNVADNFATVLSSPDSGLVEVRGIDTVTDNIISLLVVQMMWFQMNPCRAV